jgi:hypothetical protein
MPRNAPVFCDLAKRTHGGVQTRRMRKTNLNEANENTPKTHAVRGKGGSGAETRDRG